LTGRNAFQSAEEGCSHLTRPAGTGTKKLSVFGKLKKDICVNRYLYLMLIPVIAYYVIFHYYPLLGAQIAFKKFTFSKGIGAASG
jgi:ABC-type polysaccharide transport system permease subunit